MSKRFLGEFCPELIAADWPAPNNVVAVSSCRSGGASSPPFDSFNLGDHVGDDPAAVAANRQYLLDSNPGLQHLQWLKQVHGLRAVAASRDNAVVEADACYSVEAGLGCAVMTADCLPLLVCDRTGSQVAAIHAGWRGLLAGVIEQTLQQFTASPDQLLVWMGPAISAAHFEVGPEVRQQFLVAADGCPKVEACFSGSDRASHFFADIYQLARLRLQKLGVSAVYGGDLCTYDDPPRFYSYRRDGDCGRMVSLIYLKSY